MPSDTIRTTTGRGRRFDSVLDTIGDTPVIRVNNLGPDHVTVYVKAEFFNPACRKGLVDGLDLLQAGNIGAGLLQPFNKHVVSCLDPIDVPGSDFHIGKIPGSWLAAQRFLRGILGEVLPRCQCRGAVNT